MPGKIEDSIKDVISSLQLAKIYPLEHPKFKESLEKAWMSLLSLLDERDELVIGIIGDEVAFEKEVFFDLSRMVKPLIQYLKEREVEKLVFRRGVTKEELSEFISFLITAKERIGADAQKYLLLKGVKNISVGKITVSSQGEAAYAHPYDDSLHKVTKPLDAVLNNEDFDYLDLQYTFATLLEGLQEGYQGILKLSVFKKHDVSTFGHLLDVAILSMYAAYKMGFVKNDVKDIGIAALFHDIGKIYISRRIIEKPEALSGEEFAIMKSHTTLGAQILLKYVSHLGILPAVVAFEHHLRYDAKGYPKVTFAQKPHPVSLIVSLCDVYEALNGRRSYKRNYPPDMIYGLMEKEKGGLFEPSLFEKFFQIIGVWPVGTVVALSDKRIAVVRQINEDDIFSPKVEVVFPAEKKEHIDLKERKNELTIESALNPFAEGKTYAHLI